MRAEERTDQFLRAHGRAAPTGFFGPEDFDALPESRRELAEDAELRVGMRHGQRPGGVNLHPRFGGEFIPDLGALPSPLKARPGRLADRPDESEITDGGTDGAIFAVHDEHAPSTDGVAPG